MKLERLLITCGGTGGHFYPGLAIAKAHQKRGGKVKLLLAGKNIESQQKIAAAQGVDSILLPAIPPLRQSPFKFAFMSIKGVLICLEEVYKFSPQALVGMGSYTSLPAVLAAKLKLFPRTPLYLHDGNARIGKANRIFSYLARFLAVAFPADNAKKIKCPLHVTGMPIREKLIESSGTLNKADSISAINKLYQTDFDAAAPTILIFGGSQGAAEFNASLPESLLEINDSRMQVLHLAGKSKLESTRNAYSGAVFKKLLLESSEQMEYFLGAADIIFCRAGGSSLAELALFGKAAAMIPYPFASEDHQRANAQCFADVDGGIILDSKELSTSRSREIIREFLEQPDLWKKRGENARKLAAPRAADDFLDRIEADLN